ncbi:hypothetical protein [Amycolatopsis circi]|uniref:hypothetical protein n=1 Tax=Amycolatopsis circi TaxID=871959 RepID=UPI000E222CF5|nr:hypothetical protein [Amycolatopsis circi]
MFLSPPSGQRLHPGHYRHATSSPGATETAPGLYLDGEGRGCGNAYGDVAIHSISFDTAGTAMLS